MVACLAIALLGACARDQSSRHTRQASADIDGPLAVFTAGSLTQPIRAALDSAAARTGTRYAQEPGVRYADKITSENWRQIIYAWTYQNLADDHGLAHVTLPDSIDLGEVADSVFYATASTWVAGATRGDSLAVRGAPIVYAIAIGRTAPHRAHAEQFVALLLGSVGQRILRAHYLDALAHGGTVGDSVPVAMARAAR